LKDKNFVVVFAILLTENLLQTNIIFKYLIK